MTREEFELNLMILGFTKMFSDIWKLEKIGVQIFKGTEIRLAMPRPVYFYKFEHAYSYLRRTLND